MLLQAISLYEPSYSRLRCNSLIALIALGLSAINRFLQRHSTHLNVVSQRCVRYIECCGLVAPSLYPPIGAIGSQRIRTSIRHRFPVLARLCGVSFHFVDCASILHLLLELLLFSFQSLQKSRTIAALYGETRCPDLILD